MDLSLSLCIWYPPVLLFTDNLYLISAVVLLSHSNCSCSYSFLGVIFLGCGFLGGCCCCLSLCFWWSLWRRRRRRRWCWWKLPSSLISLIHLYLFLPAVLAAKWCIPSAKSTKQNPITNLLPFSIYYQLKHHHYSTAG